jgi:signal transduction histidine kinase/DNA-binding response OmpR family regulator
MSKKPANSIPERLSVAVNRPRQTIAGIALLLASAGALAGLAYWLLGGVIFSEALNRNDDLRLVMTACVCAMLGVVAGLVAYKVRRSTDASQQPFAPDDQSSGRLISRPDELHGNSPTMTTQAMGDYVANVSHEIRTSMSCVLGMTNILLQTRMTAIQREYVTVMKNSCESMLGLVGSVLDFSSTEAGRIVLDSVAYSVREKTADVVQLFAPEAARKGLQIETHIAGDVPAEVRGDPLRFRQILANLLSNAIKFSEQGIIQVNCRKLAGEPESGGHIRLEFAVVDTGIGIPARYQSAIFERFGRVNATADENATGSGLGLSIARELVGLMGGTIGVASRPDSGSRFWFTMPVSETGAVPAIADRDLKSSLATVPEALLPYDMPHQDRKLLVIDDNDGNRLVAKRMCEELGYRVETAASGEAALEAHAAETFAAILIDCQMPGLSGNEVTSLIRKREPAGIHTPIIAVTANVQPADRHKALCAGVDAYLSKPIFIEELAATLKDVFERGSADQTWQEVAGVPTTVERHPSDILDMSVVNDLLGVPGSRGRDLYTELADQFVQLAPRSIVDLERAAKSRDMNEIRRLAHYLLGVCRQLGVERLAEVCASLEQLENDSPQDLVQWHMARIRAEFRAANDLLDERHNFPFDPDRFRTLAGH